jgi:hypothetical protein
MSANVRAAKLGIGTPVCSCSALALFIAFVGTVAVAIVITDYLFNLVI